VQDPGAGPEWGEYEGHPASSSAGEISGLAVTSLVLGILGLFCFPGVAGIAAIAFGIAARSDIAQSGGRRSGFGVANAGIVTGGVGIALVVVGLAAMIALAARPRPTAYHGPPARPPAIAHPPATAPTASASTRAPRVDPDYYRGVRTARVGRVVLVDLGPEVASLDDELTVQRQRAEQEGRKLLLWVTQDDCPPCNGVAASLLDPRMQDALAGVLIVRVDLRDYHQDLERRGIPAQFIPSFSLLDADNRPVDYLHGGEWDEDVPENIAPVLGRFVAGTYTHRRHPWHSLPDSNVTPI
jgi:hypothetical protein